MNHHISECWLTTSSSVLWLTLISYVAPLLEGGQLGPTSSFSNHIAPITCIGSAYQTSRGQQAGGSNHHSLVSCDQEGLVSCTTVTTMIMNGCKLGVPDKRCVIKRVWWVVLSLPGMINVVWLSCSYIFPSCTYEMESIHSAVCSFPNNPQAHTLIDTISLVRLSITIQTFVFFICNYWIEEYRPESCSVQITIWDTVTPSNLSLVSTISQSSQPVVSVALRGNSVIVARLEGCLQVYDMVREVIKVSHHMWESASSLVIRV
jgi:hypothetical protein